MKAWLRLEGTGAAIETATVARQRVIRTLPNCSHASPLRDIQLLPPS